MAPIDKSTLITFGAGAGALVAIVAFVMLFAPLIRSPFASTSRVDDVVKSVEIIAKTQQQMTSALNQISNRMDNQDLGYWNSQLELAQTKLKTNPNDDLAIAMARVARNQIFDIQARITIQVK